jgi:hypothetical protein
LFPNASYLEVPSESITPNFEPSSMAGPSNSVPGPSNSMTGLFDVPIGPSSLDTVVVPASEPDFNRSLSNHPHEKKPALRTNAGRKIASMHGELQWNLILL